MDTSWEHTREALKNLACVLICGKCGKEPLTATRLMNCGHIFCKQCIDRDANCIKCNAPIQPTEICPDHTIMGLVQSCNAIAEIVHETNLWNAPKTGNSTSHTHTTVPSLQAESKNKKLPSISKNVIKNINKRNPRGETPLHSACLKKQEELVKTLLAAGANPNTKDNAKWTPLQEVVSFGSINLCQLLLEAGALPNVPGAENRTSLHEAAINNRIEEAKMLLRYNASKNVYDQYGKRPIDYNHTEEMREVLEDQAEEQGTADGNVELNRTLDQSLATGSHKFVIFPSDLKDENKKLLSEMAQKYKLKITTSLRSHVTHIVVEANSQNIISLTYNIMVAILRGIWLLNTEWITLGIDLDELTQFDLELFEVCGAPTLGVPKKARENAQSQNPGLFNRCYFYFAMQPKNSYYIDDVELTKENVIKLVMEGDGIVLTREPDPEDIKQKEQAIPFHTAHDLSHPLHNCTHYIIYVPGRDEPRIKYNMPHIKSLPLVWFIECIEKFTLLDPSHLGLT